MPSPHRSFLRPAIARIGLGLALGVILGASCKVQSIYTCLTHEDCVAEGGEGGVCEPNNLCTFPDAACLLGKRWHDRAGEDLAGKCYDPSDLGGGTDGVADTDAIDSDTTTTGGSGTTGATTLPADDTADSSSSGPPPVTDTGESSSGGTPAGCADLFGTVPDYELCEETDQTCRFNATLNQTSCGDLCGTFGTSCVDAFENSASDCASQGASVGCDAPANDNICVCAKP
jgi:hypothetical protein